MRHKWPANRAEYAQLIARLAGGERMEAGTDYLVEQLDPTVPGMCAHDR